MRVYLVRHGDAVSDAEDPRRPLSEAGRGAVERVAQHLARLRAIPATVVIRHSGKLRAEQTAQIFARALGAQEPQAASSLAPNDPVEPALDLMDSASGDLMLVGHLPHLDLLASRLLCGSSSRPILDLQAGATLCCNRVSYGWLLEWMLPPRLVPGDNRP